MDLLAKIVTKAAPVDDIESIRAMIALKDGSNMTIAHPAVEEKFNGITYGDMIKSCSMYSPVLYHFRSELLVKLDIRTLE